MNRSCPLNVKVHITLVRFYVIAAFITLCSTGCFVSGLYLEGGSWDLRKGCIAHQKPKQLTFPLPVMKVIPVEAHRLKLQVYKCPVQIQL